MNADQSVRYLCMSVDVQGYGRLNDPRQAQVQRELVTLLDAAGQRAGLCRGDWIRQSKGDEELALIPATEPQPRVVDTFVLELAALLFRRNCDAPGGERLRLRLALDHGLVGPAANGVSGQPVVAVTRLGSAAQVKAIAVQADADLIVVLAQGIYRDLIQGGHTSLRPDMFRKLHVREKEFSESAWVWLPGQDIHRLPECTPDRGPADETGAPAMHHLERSGSVSQSRTRTSVANSGVAGNINIGY